MFFSNASHRDLRRLIRHLGNMSVVTHMVPHEVSLADALDRLDNDICISRPLLLHTPATSRR
jgi:hypothetical protein